MLNGARLLYLILYVRDLAASRAFYEEALGLRAVEADAASVKYAAGHVILCLHRAADHGITLREGRDRSIDITFLVDDLPAVRAALEARGVRFSPTLAYAVGKTTDFYDPDGHWFSLYEPSEAAMTWPSADKIRALRALARGGRAGGDGAPPVAAAETGLDGRELVYLFLFVEDLDATWTFYHDALGLEAVEGGPCKRVPTSAPQGVVKYDAGGTLLTTHHVEGDADAAKYRVATRGAGGVALAFHVDSLEASVDALARAGVACRPGPAAADLGTLARFEDPAGHRYFLCESSAAVRTRPAGAHVDRILTAAL